MFDKTGHLCHYYTRMQPYRRAITGVLLMVLIWFPQKSKLIASVIMTVLALFGMYQTTQHTLKGNLLIQ
jgi:hypothetical protein